MPPAWQRRLMERDRLKKREKYCVVCGRRMLWRRKWRNDWDNLRYCSRTCLSMGLREVDRRIEGAMLELLLVRGVNKSICPSEAARIVADAGSGNKWQLL